MVLAVVLCFSPLTLGASAADNSVGGTCGDNLTWSLNLDSGLLEIDGKGKMVCSPAPWESYKGDIKSVIIGNSVTSVDKSAFAYCTELTSVTIGNGVRIIDDSAFMHCYKLADIVIPDSVSTIGCAAFQYCTGLKTAKISNRVLDIGSEAFSFCSSLENVTLSENISEINERTFAECVSLTSITIYNPLERICEAAFYNCKKLSYVKFSNNVTEIETDCFEGCGEIKQVDYVGSEADWSKMKIADGNEYLTASKINFIIGDCITVIGEANLPYFKIGEQVVLCLEPDKLIPESQMFYAESESDKDIDFLLPLFSCFEAAEKTDKTYKTLQQAVWHKITGKDSFRDRVRAFVGKEYLPLYDALISATAIDESVRLQTYAPEGSEYQMMIGYYTVQNLKSYDYDVEIFFRKGCFDKTVESLELEVMPLNLAAENSRLYIADRKIMEYIEGWKINVASSAEQISINDGFKVTVKVPIPSNCVGDDTVKIRHLYSDKKGSEYFAVNPAGKEKQLVIKDGCFEFEVSSLGEFEILTSADVETTVKIENKTENKTVNYRDKILFVASVENMPVNGMLVWFVNGEKVCEGETYMSESAEKDFEISAKVVDDDNVAVDKDGKEVADSCSVTVRAGFWQKLISFFKNLFGISRVVVQALEFAK